MIFGNNYVSISPEALTKQFNYNYATKNIITFEEAFVEMAKAALKREKSQQISMPTTISDAGGSLKLEKKDFKKRGQTQTKSNCC